MWKCSVCKTETAGIVCRTCGTLQWEDPFALRSLSPLAPADIRTLRDRKAAWEQAQQEQAQAREQEKNAWMQEMERRFQSMLDAQLASSDMRKRIRELESQVEGLKRQKGTPDPSDRLKSLESEIVTMKLQFAGKSPNVRVLEIKCQSLTQELEKQKSDNAALKTRVDALEARLREQERKSRPGTSPAAQPKASAAQETAEEIWLRGRKLYDTDVRGAVKLFRQAAEMGHPAAQNDMGFAYDIGRGAEKDPIQAVTWYRRAAANGDPLGQTNLGRCYQYGTGVTQDDDKAVHWYRQAAEQGLAKAQYWLGICYKNGKGVNKDIAEAALWMKKAAEGKYPNAKEAYNALFTWGTSAQLNARGFYPIQ